MSGKKLPKPPKAERSIKPRSTLGFDACQIRAPYLDICLKSQQLQLRHRNHSLKTYPISSARLGYGEQKNSYQTPRGWHAICAKIGGRAAINTIFKGRQAQGLFQADPQTLSQDWILSRILWLTGLEPGFNQGGNCDSKARYIYIHGTPDEVPIDRPASQGCIRMRNADIIELYRLVRQGTKVLLHE